jgi:uncharacterized protein (TIGR03083 family)
MDDPILTAHLYPEIERLLLELLRSLTPDEWEMQTVAPRWKVKDVAAHLLDTELRKLSMVRDGYQREAPKIDDLVAYVNQLNQDGVAIYSRLSPSVLIPLMELASRESAAFHQSLDPFSPAKFEVSWAGEQESLNWFDTAREFTERWHHQQQIRLAVNRPGIMTPELYHPVLDCFMRALPHTYRNVQAESGTLLQFEISGECGGTWWLYRSNGPGWRLVVHPVGSVAARVVIPQEIAWRVFTKWIDKASAAAQVSLYGDEKLGLPILSMTSIVG